MERIAEIRKHFEREALAWHKHSKNRIYMEIKPSDIIKVSKYLIEIAKARFIIISGVDTPNGIELLYHFSFDENGLVFTVRVLLKNKKNPELESITCVIKGVEWIEREIWELLGVVFKNHPNLKHLLLVDDWPEGNYPLRRNEDETYGTK